MEDLVETRGGDLSKFQGGSRPATWKCGLIPESNHQMFATYPKQLCYGAFLLPPLFYLWDTVKSKPFKVYDVRLTS